MQRRAEFRPFSWLHDLWKRDQLDLSPPYQRRSVWPPRFRTEFITTVLLNYPCPAVFLFEEIKPDGSFLYKVIDGKQRLTTLFDFVSDKIEVSEDHSNPTLRGRLFSSLDDSIKLDVWRYAFSVEFIEQENEAIINDIFNRINKNVAKLTQQELRHARFTGPFITEAERLAETLEAELGAKFPNFLAQSKRQMKDVESVASLLLFIEVGERSFSQSDLDTAFSNREEEWPDQERVVSTFETALGYIKSLLSGPEGDAIRASRLRNQADFYSLFAAVVELDKEEQLPSHQTASARLASWLIRVRAVENGDNTSEEIGRYLEAARAASNDATPRRTRINTLKLVMSGQ